MKLGNIHAERYESSNVVITCGYVDQWRQGDIISIYQESKLIHHGVIINADCDLANHKTDGVFAYLPIYDMKQYFEQFSMPNYIKAEINNLIAQIRTPFGLSDNEVDDLIDWTVELGVDGVIDQYAVGSELNANKTKKLRALLEQITKLRDPAVSTSLKFQNICNEKSDPYEHCLKTLRSAYAEIKKSHFFIPELPNQYHLGYVIRLKRIYSISENQCSTSPLPPKSAEIQGLSYGVRIGRLSANVRYRIIQLFAIQFSRIGLPNEIDILSDYTLNDTATRILSEGEQ